MALYTENTSNEMYEHTFQTYCIAMQLPTGQHEPATWWQLRICLRLRLTSSFAFKISL